MGLAANSNCPNQVTLSDAQCVSGSVPLGCSNASKTIANTPGICAATLHYAAPSGVDQQVQAVIHYI